MTTQKLPATAPNIHIWPAMGVRASYYQHFPLKMAARGWRATVHEWRGHGTSEIRPGRGADWGYRALVEEDMCQAAEQTREMYPDAPLWLFGHSLGGQLGMLLGATRPDLVDRVITVAACSVYWRAFPSNQAWKILLGTQTAASLARLLGSFPGERVGFAGHEAAGVMRDWAHQSRTGRYAPYGSAIDYEDKLARCPIPTLNISIAGDRQMAPREAVDHLAQKVPHHRRAHVDDPSWSPRGRHFSWVKTPGAVFDQIARV